MTVTIHRRRGQSAHQLLREVLPYADHKVHEVVCVRDGVEVEDDIALAYLAAQRPPMRPALAVGRLVPESIAGRVRGAEGDGGLSRPLPQQKPETPPPATARRTPGPRRRAVTKAGATAGNG